MQGRAPGHYELSQDVNSSPGSSSSRETNGLPASGMEHRHLNTDLHPHSSSTRTALPQSSSLASVQRSSVPRNLTQDSSQSSRAPQTNNAPAQKLQKGKMNLLNPVSLLRRRRTAQHNDRSSDTSGFGHQGLDVPAMKLPEDYDPRIRGIGVHDFNAPRARRNYSTNDIDRLDSLTVGNVSPIDEHRRRNSIPGLPLDSPPPEIPRIPHTSPDAHSPIFVEQFDNGEVESTPAAHDGSLAHPIPLTISTRRFDEGTSKAPISNAAANALRAPEQPSSSSGSQSNSTNGQRVSRSTVGGATSGRNSSEHSTTRSSISIDTRATSPPGSPNLRQRSSSTGPDASLQSEGLSTHLLSTASISSRFSFQLNSDQNIAQEKALEAKAKQREFHADDDGSVRDSRFDDFDEDGMFDDFDGEGPYEEPIPMINGDDDSEAWPMQDSNGSIGDRTLESKVQDRTTAMSELDVSHKSVVDVGIDKSMPSRQRTSGSAHTDDMYFDDGNFDEPSPDETSNFDESFFDRPMIRTDLGSTTSNGPTDAQLDESLQGLKGNHQTDFGPSSSRSLDEWHGALASAANNAEAAGRFRRRPSGSDSMPESETEWPGLGRGRGWSDPRDDMAKYDDLDFDGLEEDPMIAEANAEILASDDAEFYGQEFGIYGASSSMTAQAFNGGYFVSAEDLNRSKSGKNASREPNLTPITERSEFSGRNSVVSLVHLSNSYILPDSAVSRNENSLPSPGLREIAEQMASDSEEEMSLSQLMHLRKSTFGGGARVARNSSPASVRMQDSTARAGDDVSAARDEDAYEDMSKYDAVTDAGNDEDLFPVSPIPASLACTLSPATEVLSTDKTPRFMNGSNQQIPRSPSSQESTGSSPVSDSFIPSIHPSQLQNIAARPPASSAAYSDHEKDRAGNPRRDSSKGQDGTMVAYILEDEQWYLERRRRIDGGKLIVVGRELVAGGTI